MKHFKLKLTALTPIHLGTGEMYEPTNFCIIDGFLHEFDSVKFFKTLSKSSQHTFIELVTSQETNALFKLHSFIKNNSATVLKSTMQKVAVSKEMCKEYESSLGTLKQQGKGAKIFNQFHIAKTLKMTNPPFKAFVAGGSLKGAISTAYQEYLYKQDKTRWKECFQNSQKSIFKNLVISDAKLLSKTQTRIGYALNKKRFEENKGGLSTRLEVIPPQSVFEATLSLKEYNTQEALEIQTLQNACNEHYYELFKSMFNQENLYKHSFIDDYIIAYFDKKFSNIYSKFKPSNKQFLLRLGKHSGARAVTIEGMREIKVKGSKKGRKSNRWESLKEETSTWLFGEHKRSTTTLLPFGWVLCEIKE